MIKGSIQEDITTLNIYAPNTDSPQYMKQLLTTLKGQINNNTIRVGTLTPHLHQWIDHSDRKSAQHLNDTLDQIDLTNIYQTFHPKAAEYTLLSSAHTVSRIIHILGHTSSLGKFKMLKLFQTFSLITML